MSSTQEAKVRRPVEVELNNRREEDDSRDQIGRAESLVQSVVDRVKEGTANLDVSRTILLQAQVHATLASAYAALAVARATQDSWTDEGIELTG